MKFNKTNNILVNSIYNFIKNNYKTLYNSYQFKTKNQKYKFSICYPMGLFEKNNNIWYRRYRRRS